MSFKNFSLNNLNFFSRQDYLCIINNKYINGKSKNRFCRKSLVVCRFFFDSLTTELKKHVNFFVTQDARKVSYIRKLIGKKLFVMFYYPVIGKYTKFHFRKFVGKCISLKRAGSNTAVVIIKNTFNRYPIEFRLFLYSPFFVKLKIFENKNPFFRINSRRKLYYLRKN